jgi:hypothetical protein
MPEPTTSPGDAAPPLTEDQAIRQRVKGLTSQVLQQGRVDPEAVRDVVRAVIGRTPGNAAVSGADAREMFARRQKLPLAASPLRLAHPGTARKHAVKVPESRTEPTPLQRRANMCLGSGKGCQSFRVRASEPRRSSPWPRRGFAFLIAAACSHARPVRPGAA